MHSKTFVLVSPKNRTAYNFRGELIEQLGKRGYEVYVTGPNRTDVDRIEALGARFVEIPNDKNGINALADIRYFFRLLRLFRRLRPQATLGYTVKPVIYGSIAARLAGVRSITAMITGAGYLFVSTSFKARVLRSIAKILYRCGLAAAHRVVFQNPDDRREFIDNGLVRAAKTAVVNGSGVNLAKFPQAPFPDRMTFFMLSRVMYAKGVREYLEAARQVKARHPEVRFVLLGAFEHLPDSIPEAKVRREFIDTGIVEYHGESRDIASFYARCSVFVLPSYREGTPRTVLEAMATGRPILTTDVPGCRQTVVDGQNGFLVPPKNPGALAEKMVWFIENPDALERMGAKSHALCREKFEVAAVNRQMLTLMHL